MNYSIKLEMNLDAAALGALIRTLDAGPHGLMRGIIDNIIQQVQAQEAEHRANAEAEPTDVVDGMPVSQMPN